MSVPRSRSLELPPSGDGPPEAWREREVGRLMRGIGPFDPPVALDREAAERFVARRWRAMPLAARRSVWQLEDRLSVNPRSPHRKQQQP